MTSYSHQAQEMRRIMINRMVVGQRLHRRVKRQVSMEFSESESEDEEEITV